jgi:hypothetical protein
VHNEIQCEKMNLLLCRDLVPAMCAGKRPLHFKTETAPKQRIACKKIIFMLNHECQEYARSRMRVAKYVTCHVVSR